MTSSKIFVTGASGFLGRYLVDSLQSRYPMAKLTILVRTPLFIPGSETICADLRDIDKYRSALTEADFVFHLAANAKFGGHFDYQKDNVEPLDLMLSAIRGSGRPEKVHFIFVSSIGAFDRSVSDDLRGPIDNTSSPNPRSAYGRSKLEGERLLKLADVKYTIVRPSWIYGAGMRTDSHVCAFAAMLERRALLARFAFPGKVSLVHVQDLAEALVRIPEQTQTRNKEYFVSAEDQSIGYLLKTLAKEITGRSFAQLYVSSMGPARWLHHLLPIQITNLFESYLTCEGKTFWTDTGHSPQRTWRASLTEVVGSTAKRRMYVVVTGANSGIGLALAESIQREGRKLILVDKQTDQVDRLASESVKIFKTDLSNKNEVNALTDKLKAHEIVVLINNAGVGFRGDFAEMSRENIETMIMVNICAPLQLTHDLLPNLKKSKACIVNITSSTAIHPLPHMSTYAATKSFLRSWSMALSEELKATNHVLTFAPSGTRTNFQKMAGVRSDKSQALLSPEAVAKSVQTAIAKRRRSGSTGLAAGVLNFVSFLIPIGPRLKLWSFLFKNQR